MKAKKPVPRKKKKSPPFRMALAAARLELAMKLQRRDSLVAELHCLNFDIPNLDRTVRALEAQLGGTGAVSPLTSQTDNKKVGGVSPRVAPLSVEMGEVDLKDIPPEIRAQLPPEDFSKFGSHFGAEPAEKEDFLPEIEGKPLIPEKP